MLYNIKNKEKSIHVHNFKVVDISRVRGTCYGLRTKINDCAKHKNIIRIVKIL